MEDYDLSIGAFCSKLCYRIAWNCSDDSWDKPATTKAVPSETPLIPHPLMNLSDSPVSSHTDSLTQNGSENMTLGTFHIKMEDYDLSIGPFCVNFFHLPCIVSIC